MKRFKDLFEINDNAGKKNSMTHGDREKMFWSSASATAKNAAHGANVGKEANPDHAEQHRRAVKDQKKKQTTKPKIALVDAEGAK